MKSDPLARARASMEGLSVGDAFGETFFGPMEETEDRIIGRRTATGPWPYTDDTEMALSVVSVLSRYDSIQQDALAESFARNYDDSRGYGPSMHRLLMDFSAGADWRERAESQFGGRGSHGNGAAMRVAPVGAYFADDLDAAVEQAERSAVVTHTHPEAVAGAIAVSVAAAYAWRLRSAPLQERAEFLDLVLPWVPPSEVAGKLRKARDMTPHASVRFAVSVLGNGSELSAQDTVPFALWCAASHLNDYEEALWQTVSGLGDRDTTCAIVGGVVAAYTGTEGIPSAWIERREALPHGI